MYQWVRPKVAIPVHGEARHLAEHAKLARDCQVPEAVVAENGTLIALSDQGAEVLDHVPTGRVVLDGTRIIPANSPQLRERQRLMFNGSAMVSLVVDEKGHLLDEPRITIQGLLNGEEDDEIRAEVVAALFDGLESLPKGARRSDERLGEAARVSVRRALARATGKKPVTQVHLIRLPD